MKTIFILAAFAASLPLIGRAQTNPGSAAVPIKELTPPPPNPADGKHLIKPAPSMATGIVTIDRGAEMEWAFKDRDANTDGKLSKEEFPEGMRPGFVLADKDKDNYVSLAEYLTHLRPAAGSGAALIFGDLPYADTKNTRQQLDLYLPRKPRTDRPLPVVVFIHGGGWQKGSKAGGRDLVHRFVQTGE